MYGEPSGGAGRRNLNLLPRGQQVRLIRAREGAKSEQNFAVKFCSADPRARGGEIV